MASVIKIKPGWLPKCPSCGTPLSDCGFPLPEKGRGFCGVGQCYFDFEADVEKDKVAKDKNGNLTKMAKWKITGEGHEQNNDYNNTKLDSSMSESL